MTSHTWMPPLKGFLTGMWRNTTSSINCVMCLFQTEKQPGEIPSVCARRADVYEQTTRYLSPPFAITRVYGRKGGKMKTPDNYPFSGCLLANWWTREVVVWWWGTGRRSTGCRNEHQERFYQSMVGEVLHHHDRLESPRAWWWKCLFQFREHTEHILHDSLHSGCHF